ncbi:MAG: DUF6231 family protein [Granulosicoccus sp.]
MQQKSQAEQARFLDDCLFGETPLQLLIVGEPPQPLLNRAVEGVSISRLETLEAAERQAANPDSNAAQIADGRCVLVLAIDLSDSLFEQRLGRAIRAFPHRVLLHCTTTSTHAGKGDEDFFAFGFRKLLEASDAANPDVTIKWFEYKLSQYKSAPDWLNSRYWANPDRFGVAEDTDYYSEDTDDDDEEE